METLRTIVEALIFFGAVAYTTFFVANFALMLAGKRTQKIESPGIFLAILLWTIWLYMRGIL